MAGKPSIRRCAVYTRKSSEEGLQQEFNSLDAQREAGVAYIRSQAGEGWRLVESRYDDPAISGGTLERPALRRLLDDIATGKVHIVVVYKVDRLTRSLADFAKLIEVFERHDVSFVSVTQQFNTTTSMGRLMLNVLLSFAQFEREVTGERIRDKIAASKKKGMWMGGTPPIGYEVRDRKLVIVRKEANLVGHIYRRYMQLGCVTLLARELAQGRHLTRRYTTASGRVIGGKPFSRGHLHRILTNRIYLGEIEHHGAIYPGEHKAIIDAKIWAGVEAQLAANRRGLRSGRGSGVEGSLRGKVYDAVGELMIPTQARRGARRYRYYVSRSSANGMRETGTAATRVPAGPFEATIVEAVNREVRNGRYATEWKRFLGNRTAAENESFLLSAISRVAVEDNRLQITMRTNVQPPDIRKREMRLMNARRAEQTREIGVPFDLVRRGQVVHLVAKGGTEANAGKPDQSLLLAVIRGSEWARRILQGESPSVAALAREARVTPRYVSRLMRYAFLAPDITEAILSGSQSSTLTVERLRHEFPMPWSLQRLMFDGPTPAR